MNEIDADSQMTRCGRGNDARRRRRRLGGWASWGEWGNVGRKEAERNGRIREGTEGMKREV